MREVNGLLSGSLFLSLSIGWLSPLAANAALADRQVVEAKLKDRAIIQHRADQALLQLRSPSGSKLSLSPVKTTTPAQPTPHSKIRPLSLQSLGITIAQPILFSPADYLNNMNVQWATLVAPPDAETIQVNFDYIDLESGYDFVYIEDVNGVECNHLTGVYGPVTVVCPGNVAKIIVVTDSTEAGFDFFGNVIHNGFSISGYTYTITPLDTAPIAIAQADRYQASVGKTFFFDASLSSDVDPGDFISQYFWDFGDGTGSGAMRVGHAYTAPGNYQVSLTVWDSFNVPDTYRFTVVVNAVAPPAGLAVALATESQLGFSWAPGDNDTIGYVVDFDGGNGANLSCNTGVPIQNLTSVYYPDLKPSTLYSFLICSYNAAGIMSDGVLLSAYTAASPVVLPPLPVLIDSIRKDASGAMVISFHAPEAGRTYSLQGTSTLGAPTAQWTSFRLVVNSSAVGQALSFRVMPPPNWSQGFYRVMAQ